jgi:hypothetical protein
MTAIYIGLVVLTLAVAYKFMLWLLSGYELDAERDLKRWSAAVLIVVGIFVVNLIIDQCSK